MGAVWRWLASAFTENLGLKLLAFTFALGLFAYQRFGEDNQQRTIPVGVVLRLPPESSKRELMTQPPANIHVILQGTTRAIDQLIQTGVAPVEIDLRDGRTERVVFEPEMFSLPPDVEVTIIDPAELKFEWQDVITRRIPVQASITGQTAEGYEVQGDLTIEPTHVTVEGPASLVEVMQFARLSPFDVNGLTEGEYRRRIAIDAPPTRVRYISPANPRPNVTVRIARRVTDRPFPNRPVEVIGVVGAKTNPTTVEVKVIAPPEVLQTLKPELVVPRVDLTKVDDLDLEDEKHGSRQVKVEIDLAGAEAKIQPPTVTVRW